MEGKTMIIEGKNSVYEALRGDVTFNKLLISNTTGANNIVALAKEKGVKVEFVDRKIVDKYSNGNCQGVIGFVTDYKYYSVEDILDVAKIKGKDNFIVLLDGIEDPHNLGSIIRVCECAGVDGIIIEEKRACAVTDTVVRVSAGAVNHTKIARVTNLNNTIRMLKEKNIWVYGCELGGQDVYQSNLTGNIAIVIGSEGKGIGKLTRELCDEIVTLPMFGKVNSLNASTATSVVVFEAVRQRIKNGR